MLVFQSQSKILCVNVCNHLSQEEEKWNEVSVQVPADVPKGWLFATCDELIQCTSQYLFLPNTASLTVPVSDFHAAAGGCLWCWGG